MNLPYLNLPNLNYLVCEWLNLEKKKRIKKIKVKKCVGVTDEVLREKGERKKRKRKRVLWNVLEFGGSGREKKRKEGKKRKK